MGDEISYNLDYLCQNITNLTEILIYLIKHDTISQDESDEIMAELTPLGRNFKLLKTVQKKDWNRVGDLFLEILRKTNNKHCTDKIEGISTSDSASNTLQHPKISKWWPEKKLLIKSLHKRKFGSRLLVEELHERILADENRMVVLCESADAAKYSGMGGVGKTLTAKWYAHHYEKEYDHILWIDCGEDSLLKSFKKLAMELQIENWDRYDEVEDFSRNSFHALTEFKCLWIYDNAENYKGKDGIINVLPKNQKNFFCLITSRSREWGVKNGFPISELQLEIFNDEESLEFLNANLEKEINRNEEQLKELCGLMGNLPLALQLAVAALNAGKIDLLNYLEKTAAEDSAEIVAKQFDDYEKTINKNIKISLDLILEDQKNGKLAFNILMAFGYIRPDNVQSKLFLKISNRTNAQLQEAINLLEKYSLISKTGKVLDFLSDGFLPTFFAKKVETDLLSIHRLLQQVIRHNGKETERETLKKILRCQGFIDYKLIPFTKYADEKLQKEFPKVKAQLLDQEQLKKLMREKRYEECVQFAKFIDQELKTMTTKFNYCVCLVENGQVEDSLKIVEKWFGQRFDNKIPKQQNKKSFLGTNEITIQLLKLDEVATKRDVGTLLIFSYLKLKNNLEALKIAKEIITDVFEFMEILTLAEIPNYSLKFDGETIDLNLDEETRRIDLRSCSLSLMSFVRFFRDTPDLTLWDVYFRDRQELTGVKVNDIVNLTSIKRLTLYCDDKKSLYVDLSGEVTIDYLHLHPNVQVLNWNKCNWNVKQLEIWSHPFIDKTSIKVQEMTSGISSLDVSCLPQTIQKIILVDMREVFMSGGVELPNLKHLTLKSMDGDVCCFQSAPLTHINLIGIKGVLNVDLLPPTLTHLRITKHSHATLRVVGGVRKVDHLILRHFSFGAVEKCLSHFHTDDLLIRYEDGIGGKELMDLMKKGIKTMAVGRIKWGEEEFKNYSSQLDRQKSYYVLEGGRGMAMKSKEFYELSETC